MIIDGKNKILGRIASFAAKKALEGEKVEIINCEEIIITGNKKMSLKKFKERRDRGDPHKGPYYPRMSDRIVRRAIRGMLPYKQEKGKVAFSKIKCFIGTPKGMEEVIKLETRPIRTKDFLRIKQISNFLGAKTNGR
ncbi:MAG TPA: 50S ribosomal protein L13 [Candidatus Nanoarchaeia archaeon]|nr:50S ribosomal protein L13 [Candidatus Nanoarchaeia archaeon]